MGGCLGQLDKDGVDVWLACGLAERGGIKGKAGSGKSIIKRRIF